MTMDAKVAEKGNEKMAIEAIELDMSSLVGRKIMLLTEQFPGKRLTSKILSANQEMITVDRSGGGGLINDLVSNQSLFVQFGYKGQRVSVKGTVKRSSGGRCALLLDKKVVPLLRRRFMRVPVDSNVKLAVYPEKITGPSQLKRLRWMETELRNISCGGALIEHSGCFNVGAFMLVNINVPEIPFPSLLMSQVRHCNHLGDGHFHVGVEFIVRDTYEKYFSPAVVKNFPAIVLEYSEKKRDDLNKQIISLMRQQDEDNQ